MFFTVFPKHMLDNRLRTGIKEVERFIEYQQLRVMKHSGDNTDFLFITGRIIAD